MKGTILAFYFINYLLKGIYIMVKNETIQIENRNAFYMDYMKQYKKLEKAKINFKNYDNQFKKMFDHTEKTMVSCDLGNIVKKTSKEYQSADLDAIKKELGPQNYENNFTKSNAGRVKITFNYK